MNRLFACALVLGLLSATPALAQLAPKCPDGQTAAVIRISAITGTREGFDKAVKDHIQWYRDHGFTQNRITVGEVLLEFPGGKPAKPAQPEMIAIHTGEPGIPAKDQDDAWRAYVAEYRANSKILSQTVACLPK